VSWCSAMSRSPSARRPRLQVPEDGQLRPNVGTATAVDLFEDAAGVQVAGIGDEGPAIRAQIRWGRHGAGAGIPESAVPVPLVGMSSDRS
jgi:hypothetical protein